MFFYCDLSLADAFNKNPRLYGKIVMLMSFIGMLPISLIPSEANELLIINEDVWDTGHYFRIFFPDSSILRMILENQLPYDNSTSSLQCYPLPHGQYYIVETDRYSYQGTSLTITSEGIGIRDCYNNHLSIDASVKSLTEGIDSSYQKDYSKPDLFPM